jgi:deoxycytidylate deaminase
MRHQKWLKLALKKAKESPINPYKHCAVLVKGGRLLAFSTNNHKPGITFDKLYINKKLHAEAAVLSQFSPEEVKNATLYVAGQKHTGFILNSKPCKCCQEILKRYPLKAIYYMEHGKVKQLV